MTRRSGSFRSSEGLTLHTLSWEPVVTPRAQVVLSHGYAEHAGRYDVLAEALTKRDMAVYALDFPGHGRSAGRRGWVNSFAGQVTDLGAYVSALRADEPHLRCGLFGHSVGGAVAASLCAREPEIVDALALSAPYLRHGKPVTRWQLMGMGVLAKILPRLGVAGIDPDELSRIPAEVEAYRNDPLVFHGKTPAHVVHELFNGFDTIAAAHRITAPLLVIHGSEDRIADPSGSRELSDRVSSTDVEYELLPGGFHEALNDLEQGGIVEHVSEWLAARLIG